MSATAEVSLEATIQQLARQAYAASLSLATLPTETKNAVLETLAGLIESRANDLRAANAKDLQAGAAAGLSKPMLDRLELTPKRIAGMTQGVREVAALPDPVGRELDTYQHPQDFTIRKVSVPIGVVGIIYESRPNVTIDCAALCLKSGNATILRGGKEAFHSNGALAELIQEALRQHGVNPHAVQLVPTTDRAALNILLKLDDYIHCIIPRGGESLIRFTAEHARMPVIKHYTGVCNVYVDAAAEAEMAAKVAVNAKCQRPSVCNAAENLIVHSSILDTTWLVVAKALADAGVELRCDEASAAALQKAGIPHAPVDPETDYDEEYLDLILAVKTVDNADEAIDFINEHGSAHSDAIVTGDAATAQRFLNGVDSATCYWNVSTRFTDGYEFGLGAEIGISTDKLHARGPMGLNELTTYKYQIVGNGQIRG
ncbi:MAG: glutamate-5-semialdehyde dehydrogenase [Verrucomicrobiota bacterium JB022]|nr:glutamate-5-semialdehyde dehydrogenase [Verrucomicrobiota bacterium JB022]